MDDSLNTLLALIDAILKVSSANPIFIGVTVFGVGLLYGFLKYKSAKHIEEQVLADLEEDRSETIDSLEEETQDSNDRIRDRLNNRK